MYKTGYHAKYFASILTLKNSENEQEKMGGTFYDSSIELNPHQIEAALFALQSARQKGVILADEVGLGKTIEAGLVIAQMHRELRDKTIVIAPPSLSKQWELELREKFGLNAKILNKYEFDKISKTKRNPFYQPGTVLLVSYQFAKNNQDLLEKTAFDLVVFDEAHKLRNDNQTTVALKKCFSNSKKVLLTATPLQNSVKDIYNLCSFIDSSAFGGNRSFNFLVDNDIKTAKEFLSLYMHRRLRKDVSNYLKYPKRYAETYNFAFTKEEDDLYKATTDYLQDERFFSNKEKGLYATVLRKQLASSTPALLSTLKNRLNKLLKKQKNNDYSGLDEYDYSDLECFSEDYINDEMIPYNELTAEHPHVSEEIEVLRDLIFLASKIRIDSKVVKLLEVIDIIYNQLSDIKGVNKKILIFTESRKTQDFLFEILKNSNVGKISRFSGQNEFPEVSEIFTEWKSKNPSAIRNQSNIRKAILDDFKSRSNILIATEAAAEGLNLQFCSVIINYDLPWNPQKIEQRIGRCHRYGQKFDVTVFNFVNSSNQIDQRVYELLDFKFKVFNGLLGASDEVLGLLEQGSDLEKKIMKIYLNCRTAEDIDKEFELLSKQFSKEISNKMAETKKALMEYFDEDISKIFKQSEVDFKNHLKKIESYLWQVCKIILNGYIEVDEDNYLLRVNKPFETTPKGVYQLNSIYNIKPSEGAIPLKLKDSFGKSIIQRALSFDGDCEMLEFDLTNYQAKISGLEAYKGKLAYLQVLKLKIYGNDEFERLLIVSAFEDGRGSIDEELLKKLFNLNATLKKVDFDEKSLEKLSKNAELRISQEIMNINLERNQKHKLAYQQIHKEATAQKSALNKEIDDLVLERQELEEMINSTIIDWEQIVELEQKREQIQSKIKKLRQELTDKEDLIDKTLRKKIKEFQTKLEWQVEKIFTIKYVIK